MTPGDGVERMFRDQVLHLAGTTSFARGWVNSGRLSRPCIYPLAAPDDPNFPAESRPGAVAPDAPLADGWLMNRLGGEAVLLAIGCAAPQDTPCRVLDLPATAELQQRYLGEAASALYLIRPDQVIAARWTDAQAGELADALRMMWEGA